MKVMPEGTLRENALRNVEKLNPDIFGPEASQTQALEKRRVTEAAYQKALADQLQSLACSANESAAYIVRGLIINERVADAGPFAPSLKSILAPACPVSAALTEQDKADLRELAKEMQPSETKQ